jgi:hypothetical protein
MDLVSFGRAQPPNERVTQIPAKRPQLGKYKFVELLLIIGDKRPYPVTNGFGPPSFTTFALTSYSVSMNLR